MFTDIWDFSVQALLEDYTVPTTSADIRIDRAVTTEKILVCLLPRETRASGRVFEAATVAALHPDTMMRQDAECNRLFTQLLCPKAKTAVELFQKAIADLKTLQLPANIPSFCAAYAELFEAWTAWSNECKNDRVFLYKKALLDLRARGMPDASDEVEAVRYHLFRFGGQTAINELEAALNMTDLGALVP